MAGATIINSSVLRSTTYRVNVWMTALLCAVFVLLAYGRRRQIKVPAPAIHRIKTGRQASSPPSKSLLAVAELGRSKGVSHGLAEPWDRISAAGRAEGRCHPRALSSQGGAVRAGAAVRVFSAICQNCQPLRTAVQFARPTKRISGAVMSHSVKLRAMFWTDGQ
jgi:hypothetical protein